MAAAARNTTTAKPPTRERAPVIANSASARKTSATVKAGDVLTFPAGPRVRVIKVLKGGTRRGPATEAQTLYEDLTPPPEARAEEPLTPAKRERGSGRPTKKERRAIDALQGDD